jgi:hypothetical protein
MELLDGKTLREYLGGQPLDLSNALALSIEVVQRLLEASGTNSALRSEAVITSQVAGSDL